MRYEEPIMEVIELIDTNVITGSLTEGKGPGGNAGSGYEDWF